MESNFDPFEQIHKNSKNREYLETMLKFVIMDIEKIGNESDLEISMKEKMFGKPISQIREEGISYFTRMKETIEKYLTEAQARLK